MNAQTYIGRLVEVSKKKYTLLEKMLQTYLLQEEDLHASSRQEHSENPAVQEDLVDKRQEMMTAIDKLDEEFHVYTERLKNTLGIQSLDELSRFNVAGRQELKEIVMRITGLLEALMDHHTKTLQYLQEKVQTAGEKNILIGKTKQASRAYQPAGNQQTPSVYFDKKK